MYIPDRLICTTARDPTVGRAVITRGLLVQAARESHVDLAVRLVCRPYPLAHLVPPPGAARRVLRLSPRGGPLTPAGSNPLAPGDVS